MSGNNDCLEIRAHPTSPLGQASYSAHVWLEAMGRLVTSALRQKRPLAQRCIRVLLVSRLICRPIDPHEDSVHMGYKNWMKPAVSNKLRRDRISRAASFAQMVSFGSLYSDTVYPRSRPRHRRDRCARRARQRSGYCGPCRGLGLSPHLGGGASQHAGHRQRRDVGCDWSYRRGNKDHPRRRGRHHAPQPRSLRHRRAVRDAGATVSRPY